MSPIQGFEVFFLFAQVVRESIEAIYALGGKPEDLQYKCIVGFTSIIVALWFLVAIFERANPKIHPVTLV